MTSFFRLKILVCSGFIFFCLATLAFGDPVQPISSNKNLDSDPEGVESGVSQSSLPKKSTFEERDALRRKKIKSISGDLRNVNQEALKATNVPQTDVSPDKREEIVVSPMETSFIEKDGSVNLKRFNDLKSKIIEAAKNCNDAIRALVETGDGIPGRDGLFELKKVSDEDLLHIYLPILSEKGYIKVPKNLENFASGYKKILKGQPALAKKEYAEIIKSLVAGKFLDSKSLVFNPNPSNPQVTVKARGSQPDGSTSGTQKTAYVQPPPIVIKSGPSILSDGKGGLNPVSYQMLKDAIKSAAKNYNVSPKAVPIQENATDEELFQKCLPQLMENKFLDFNKGLYKFVKTVLPEALKIYDEVNPKEPLSKSGQPYWNKVGILVQSGILDPKTLTIKKFSFTPVPIMKPDSKSLPTMQVPSKN